MKKIFLFIYALFLLSGIFAQRKLVIQFSSKANVPSPVYSSSSNSYTLTSSDARLNKILSNHAITAFGKKYPTAYLVNHPNAEPLDRFFIIQTSQNINRLYDSLLSYQSAIISTAYLMDNPVALYTPNDYTANFLFCGGNTNTGAQLDYINAPLAWNIAQGNSSVTIGIVDIGFDSLHEDIVNKVLPSSYYLNSSYGYHATQVAGIAAGETNNNKGYASIGNRSTIKFFDYTYNGILLAAQNGCKVINCSWLGGCNYIQDEQNLINMVHDTYSAVIVAGAGNGLKGNHCGSDGNGLVYPASYNHVISASVVGHMFPRNTYYSCFPTPSVPETNIGFNWVDVHDNYSNAREVKPAFLEYTFTHNSSVDICAPGYSVSILGQNNTYLNVGGSGTSFSSPIVAGTAALILSVNPNFSADDVEAILKCSAKDLYDIPENFPYLNQLGAGKLDAGKALQLAQTWVAGTGLSITTAPKGIKWNDILSNGINTVEEEVTCLSTQNPGKCNIGYRLEAVGTPPGQNLKWLIYYLVNGLPVSYSVKYGSSVILTRGMDYPAVNNNNGILSVAVKVEGCLPSTYFKEDRSSSCFDPACSYTCNSNLTITGNYSTAITESSTWIKTSGQTIISGTNSVKLDANPVNGYVEMKPVVSTDYFLASPSTAIGVFVAQALDGCSKNIPARLANNNSSFMSNPAANKSFSIYPNPTTESFTLVTNYNIKSTKIQIFDLNGRLQSFTIKDVNDNSKKIKCNNFSNGMYMLKLISDSNSETIKFIIQ